MQKSLPKCPAGTIRQAQPVPAGSPTQRGGAREQAERCRAAHHGERRRDHPSTKTLNARKETPWSSFCSFHRSRIHIRAQFMPRDTSQPFHLKDTFRRDTATLPSLDGRLIERRIEERAERLKGHTVALNPVTSNRRYVFHKANSCTSRNFPQGMPLRATPTLIASQIANVAS